MLLHADSVMEPPQNIPHPRTPMAAGLWRTAVIPSAVANACDSGGLAVADCATTILAGQAHIGLAIGIEKMHPLEGKLDSGKVGEALGGAAHKEDLFPPLTFPHSFAVIMDRYMKAHGYSEEDFAVIPPIFYENAACRRPGG